MDNLVQHRADFTLVSNAYFRDRSLSYKALGMLGQLLSVDATKWRFSENGLVALHSDGRASVRSALKELEDAGYLVRELKRDGKGRITRTTYHVFADPRDTKTGFNLGYDGLTPSNEDSKQVRRSEPLSENRTTGTTSGNAESVDNDLLGDFELTQQRRSEPLSDFPTSENPTSENRTHNKEYIDKRNPYLSFEASVGMRALGDEERKAAEILGARAESSSQLAHGEGSVMLVGVEPPAGEADLPSNDATPPARASKLTADGVSETEQISASTNDNMPLVADFNRSEYRAVSPESPSKSADNAPVAGSGGMIDWHLLADTLPSWMFRALNDDVARQSTALVRGACSLGWTTADLRVALEANPKPQHMSSPAGLVLTRVRQVCAMPAPSLLVPAGIDGREPGGLRDFHEYLEKTRRYVRNFWERCGVVVPGESADSIRATIASLDLADLPEDGTREDLAKRFERLLVLCEAESSGRWSS